MKYRIFSIFLTLFVIVSFTACSKRPTNEQTDSPISKESEINATDSASDSKDFSKEEASSASIITKEEAIQIALNHAGFTKEEVSHLYAEPDRDDGRHLYEVQFFHNYVEYDYDIDVQTGTILSFDKDID